MFGNRINYNKTEDNEKININLKAHIKNFVVQK